MRHFILVSMLCFLASFSVACSDDTGSKRDSAAPDGPVGQDRPYVPETGPRDSGPPREAQRPTEARPREAGGKLEAGGTTKCGTSSCITATQICVEQEPVGPSVVYKCVAVPSGCESNRTCACVKGTVCVGAFNVCIDVNTPNTVRCECPNCQ